MSRRQRPGAGPVARRLRIALLPAPLAALGLALLAVVLGAALVSAPLFLASAEEGTWSAERERTGESALAATLFFSTVPLTGQPAGTRIDRVPDLDRAVTDTVREAGLDTPALQVRLRDSLFTAVSRRAVRVQLLHRSGWEENVRVVAGDVTDDGVLLPQRLAAGTGLGPGDELPVSSEVGGAATLRISGVYAEPRAPFPEFWAPVGSLFLDRPHPVTGDPRPPSPVVLAREDAVLAVAAATRQDLLLQWTIPLRPGIGVDEAHASARRFDELQARLADPASAVARLTAAADLDRPTPESELAEALTAVDRTVELLRPPVRAVGTGAAVAALVLVGAWAAQRVRRRQSELESLVTRGMSPTGGAVHAAREALAPLVIGGALGAAAGWFLVRTAGPSPRLPNGALPDAGGALGIGLLAAVALVAVVTTALVVRLDRLGSGTLARSLGQVPWLAVTAAVAVVTAVPVLRGGVDGRGIDVLTLALPLLVTGVVAGAVTALLPRVGRRPLGRLPTGAFLALRRILTARGATRLVVLTTALSAGLILYAGALADSSERTIATKAAVASGADVVVPLVRRTEEPGPLPPGAAIVGIEEGATVVPGDFRADLLAVDPAEIGGVLRWDRGLADRPLPDLLAALADYEGDRVPALLAGPAPDTASGAEITVRFFSYYSLPIQVVGRADAFPGQTSQAPMLVVDAGRAAVALAQADRDPLTVFDRQVWSTGRTAPLLDALTAANYAYDAGAVTTADAFGARPEVRAQAWSLDYLRAIAFAAGALGLVGLALHALAQQRRRRVSALLLSRMGLSRRAADWSAALEVGLLALFGAGIAVGVALPVSAMLVRVLDPAPSLLPPPLFAVPWDGVTAVGLGVVLVTTAAGLLVARSARRTSAGEVLRDAA